MALSDLIPMMTDEPALVSILGRREGSIVIPEPARAITISSLVERAERRPVVVGVPTTAEAERLVHDLAAFLRTSESRD
jgi:hypothetical protein